MLRDELTSLLDGAVRTGVPGVAIRAIGPGVDEALYAGAYGGSRPRALNDRARFPLSCLIKPLIASLCLEAADAGRLSLTAPVSNVLPELAAGAGEFAVTLEALLCHAGGFKEAPEREIDSRWERFVDAFNAREQLFPPGRVWSYCHSGFIIASRILEELEGLPFDEILRTRILIPLEIEDAGDPADRVAQHLVAPRDGRLAAFRPPPRRGLLGRTMSDMHLTLGELGRLAGYLSGVGVKLSLAPQIRRLLAAPKVAVPAYAYAPQAELMPEHYGLGLGTVGGFAGHNGSQAGFTCTIRFAPELGMLAVVAMNVYQPGRRDRLARQVLASLGAPLQPLRPLERTWFSLSDLTGSYRGLMMGVGEAQLDEDGRFVADVMGKPVSRKIAIGPRGCMHSPGDGPPVAVSTFADPEGLPALMLNGSAFKKACGGRSRAAER